MNPEIQALQQKMADINSLLATVELNHFAHILVEKELLSYQSMSSILNTLGYSKAHQVSQLMESVVAQVRVTPKKFEDFVKILSADPALQRLTEELTKTYSRWSVYGRRLQYVTMHVCCVAREPWRKTS